MARQDLGDGGGGGRNPLNDTRPTTLVLFDIDGTLTDSGGAGGRAVATAFEEVYGRTLDLSKVDFRGRTDVSIWREILSMHGMSYLPDDPHLAAFLSKYLEHLKKIIVNSNPRSLPGTRPLLERLEREPSVALGLLTGNIEIGGRIKLQAVDLARFFPVGGFGEDGEDRGNIARAAVRRCREFFQRDFPLEHVFVVGDASADVHAARAAGAVSIAVASGWTSKAELESCGPDVVLDDLRNMAVFLETIGLPSGGGRIG